MAKTPPGKKKHILLRIAIFLVVFYLCMIVVEKIYPTVDGTVQIGVGGVLLIVIIPIASAICIPRFFSVLNRRKPSNAEMTTSNSKKAARLYKQTGREAPFMPTGPAPYRVPNSHFWETIDLPEGDFTVIDVETTGLDPRDNDIIEIGAIRYRGWEENARYQSYIRPLGMLNPDAQEKNHITWNDVSSAPLLSEELPNFLKFIGDDLLLGYYVGYDIKFLQTRGGMSIDNITFDVCRFARYSITSHNYKLDTLRDRYGLSGIPHTALGDCESTTQALFHILKEPSAQAEIRRRQKCENPICESYAE